MEEPSSKFWGLILHPQKAYSFDVEAAFRLTNAALGVTLPGDGKRTTLTLTVDKQQYVLCSLTPSKIEQASLDHIFTEGESVTFSVLGNCPIHVTGNYLPDQDYESSDYDYEDGLEDFDDDLDDDDEDDEDDDENEDEEFGTAKITELDEEDDENQANETEKRKRKASKNKDLLPSAKKQAIEVPKNWKT